MQKPKTSSATGLPTRSKRSRTNLSDLRLAPLSAKYTTPPRDSSGAKSPHEHAYHSTFVRNHPSYIQGKSAPTSPGILSRSSSRRHLHGGLSRRGSLYDNDGPQEISYTYAGGMLGEGGATVRRDAASGMPKAKSDAALLAQRTKLVAKEKQLKSQRQYQHGRSLTGGTTTPKLRRTRKAAEDDWLTRTGAAANAILQESKGQSWLASRPSAVTLTQLQDTTDEEDEGYEEMAAQSTRTSRLADDELSPVSTKASRWGSRYGSRTASRRTSRRGSFNAGSRTPLAMAGQDSAADYFAEEAMSPIEPDFVNSDEEVESADEAAVARFVQNRSFGLGGLVDRVMNFNIFKVEEREELTEDEVEQVSETEEQAKARMAAEKERKREEKEKLFKRAATQDEANDEGEGGWSDAAWLLSVASKAMF